MCIRDSCWAVEPSAVTAFLPPQSAADADADPDSDEPDGALLSLPQPASVSAAIAATETVVPNDLPMMLSFTYPTFLERSQTARTLRQRMRPRWTVCGCRVNEK